MSRFISLSSMLLVVMGAVFCYLAFEMVRSVAWTMLTHMGGIAVLLVCGAVFWLWAKARE